MEEIWEENMKRVLVAGAGGFIGSWLVKRLKAEGFWVRGVDIKYPDFSQTQADEFVLGDLRILDDAADACDGIEDVYQLAANMGGIGFITSHLADVARSNILINTNMLDAAIFHGVKRYLYTSSACVYPHGLQTDANIVPLKEEDAIPAQPEPGYGWEKLFAEQMVQYYAKDYGLDTRIVRFHNVYGPEGTYDGGREKSPAALCRKVAKAVVVDDAYPVEIWGDGKQTRTYMYIDDCVEGLRRLMESGYQLPLNLGTDEQVSINDLAHTIGFIAGKQLKLIHIDGPQGVRGRSSDNTRIRQILNWEPQISLLKGLEPTYRWISEQVNS